jgi:uncharacterized protein YjbI with pentapeptide repeats
MDPISDRERALLSDIPAFNRSELASGWEVKGKSLNVTDLSGIKLRKAFFQNVDLSGVKLARSRIQDSVFRAVTFSDSDFSNATSQGTRFINCTFRWRSAHNVRFEDCNFQDCTIQETRIEEPAFAGCNFERLSCVDTRLSGGSIQRCVVQKSNFRSVAFSKCRMEAFEVSAGGMEKVSFPFVEADRISIAGTSLDECSFGQTKADVLRLDGCWLNGVALTGGNFKSLEINNAESVRRLSAIKAIISRAAFRNCPKVAEVFLSGSTIPEFSLLKSRLHFLRVEDCFLGGSWQESVVHGLNLTRSQSACLSLKDVTFENFLILKEVRFGLLELQNVLYAPGIRIAQDEVGYSGPTRFP